MGQDQYTPLQLQELFHLEFLRWLGRKVSSEFYALKGGMDLRFFFKSFRYSEDMELDVRTIPVESLPKAVMNILTSKPFTENLRAFGIDKILPPDIRKAKQTGTTQACLIQPLN